MATKKIIYFTAGPTPTATELSEIAVLNDKTLPGFDIKVKNGAGDNSYGYGIEASDFVAGTIPTAYNAVTDYGKIDTARPALFAIWPKAGAVAAAAGTLQLHPSKILGNDVSSLVATDQLVDVTYVSGTPAKATVDVDGLVTGAAGGTGVVTITGTYTYASGKTITATSAITVI